MQEPLISVIVPVFNAQQYLSRCLDSLLHQTYRNLEIIVVDDGSSDSSLELCQQRAMCDKRVIVVWQENKGVSAARNRGLAQAAGEFITFVDADDWADPTHIQQLVQGLQGQKCDCSVCGYWLEYPQRSEQRYFPQIENLSGDEAIETMLSPYLFQGYLWNKLFRTALIRQYDLQLSESIYYLEDILFCAIYFSHSTEVHCVQASTYHYRQHLGSALRKSGATTEWLERRLTAVLAWEGVQMLCRSSRARQLCIARQKTEYAEALRCVLENGGGIEMTGSLKRMMHKGLYSVLLAPLNVKEKVKYIITALFPKQVSAYFAARKKRYL